MKHDVDGTEPSSDPKALTYQQAARAIGVSYSTVKRLVGSGQLAVIDIGPQTIRIPLKVIDEYIDLKLKEWKAKQAIDGPPGAVTPSPPPGERVDP